MTVHCAQQSVHWIPKNRSDRVAGIIRMNVSRASHLFCHSPRGLVLIYLGNHVGAGLPVIDSKVIDYRQHQRRGWNLVFYLRQDRQIGFDLRLVLTNCVLYLLMTWGLLPSVILLSRDD